MIDLTSTNCRRSLVRRQSLHLAVALAAGRLDLLYSSPNSNPWDIAAGALLIREAGGVLADSSARSVTSYDKIEMMANIDLLDVVRKYQNAN